MMLSDCEDVFFVVVHNRPFLRAFRGFMEGFSGHFCWDHFEAGAKGQQKQVEQSVIFP